MAALVSQRIHLDLHRNYHRRMGIDDNNSWSL